MLVKKKGKKAANELLKLDRTTIKISKKKKEDQQVGFFR